MQTPYSLEQIPEQFLSFSCFNTISGIFMTADKRWTDPDFAIIALWLHFTHACIVLHALPHSGGPTEGIAWCSSSQMTAASLLKAAGHFLLLKFLSMKIYEENKHCDAPLFHCPLPNAGPRSATASVATLTNCRHTIDWTNLDIYDVPSHEFKVRRNNRTIRQKN